MPAERLPEYPPTAMGNTCALCKCARRSDEPFIIDLHLDIEFEGSICLCIKCAEEIAALVDAVSPSRFAKLQAELHETQARNLTLENNQRAIHAQLGSLVR